MSLNIHVVHFCMEDSIRGTYKLASIACISSVVWVYQARSRLPIWLYHPGSKGVPARKYGRVSLAVRVYQPSSMIVPPRQHGRFSLALWTLW
jgi:hypothetical protein